MVSKIEKFIFYSFTNTNKAFVVKAIAVFAFINILILLPDLFHIFSEQSIIKSEVNQRYTFWYQPVLSWFFEGFSKIGLSSNTTLLIFIFTYLSSLLAIVLDFNKVICAFIAWFIHFTLLNSAFLFAYGADYFVSFALLINLAISISCVTTKKIQNILYSFIIRFLQIQLCLVYFFAGLGKGLGTDWFDGNAIWYAINTYGSNTMIENSLVIVAYPMIFKIVAWGTVFIELLYPFLMFNKFTRKTTLVSVLLLHIGIIVFMQLYTFGFIMILLNLIAFGHHFNFKIITKIRNYRSINSLETQTI